MSSKNTTTGLVDELRRRIADPGAYLPRIPDTAVNPGETVGNWAARAIAASLEDGTLGYVPVVERDRLAAEVEQLRYERRLLGAARMVLDLVAAGGPDRWEQARHEAEDLAQRIVDEIGHPVTDEPALGPDLRAELAGVTADADDLRQRLRATSDALNDARNQLHAVRDLTVNTDGDALDDSAEIPVGEIRRALNEPIPAVAPFPGPAAP